MRTVESPLSSTGEHAPTALNRAESVIELMAQSTDDVLNRSDRLVESLESLENYINLDENEKNTLNDHLRENLPEMKASLYNIISSQSYQDAARQKMEALIDDLNNIRTWLIDTLVILNIKKDSSDKNIQEKANLLKQVKKKGMSEHLKQDLVDDLLAEFGF